MKIFRTLELIVGVALAAPLLTGCETINQRAQDRDPLLTIATGRAIDYLISQADDPNDRAQTIIEKATIIKSAIDGDEIVSFDLLRERIVAEIPTDKLLPGEYDLVVALIDDIIHATEEKVSEMDAAATFEESKVSIVYFLDIAIRTAQFRIVEAP